MLASAKRALVKSPAASLARVMLARNRAKAV
jgi:hypothetical protein